MSTAENPESTKAGNRRMTAAIPVILTVIATIFAGLSSSEMTRSMYYRSLAAQFQSKAGAQWGYFQAKKMRAATLDANSDLALLFVVRQFDHPAANGLLAAVQGAPENESRRNPALAAALKSLQAAIGNEQLRGALRYLSGGELPAVENSVPPTGAMADAIAAVRSHSAQIRSDEIVANIPASEIDAAIVAAQASANSFEQACDPVVKAIRSLERAIGDVYRITGSPTDGPESLRPLANAIHGAALSLRFANQDFTARRYDREARDNQSVGELYEVQVLRAGFDSERHRARSKNFFYAMLCAQAGVTIASLALAKTRQSMFWLFASVAGFAALALGGYVYLVM